MAHILCGLPLLDTSGKQGRKTVWSSTAGSPYSNTREREREVRECVCVRERECVCERERVWERESVCVCVCVRERERVWERGGGERVCGVRELDERRVCVERECGVVCERERCVWESSSVLPSYPAETFHPDTIQSQRWHLQGCARLPNVYLAHHPSLTIRDLYDHVHIRKTKSTCLAKTLKDTAWGRQTTSTPLKTTHIPIHRHKSRHQQKRTVPS